jgi:TolB-like protein
MFNNDFRVYFGSISSHKAFLRNLLAGNKNVINVTNVVIIIIKFMNLSSMSLVSLFTQGVKNEVINLRLMIFSLVTLLSKELSDFKT